MSRDVARPRLRWGRTRLSWSTVESCLPIGSFSRGSCVVARGTPHDSGTPRAVESRRHRCAPIPGRALTPCSSQSHRPHRATRRNRVQQSPRRRRDRGMNPARRSQLRHGYPIGARMHPRSAVRGRSLSRRSALGDCDESSGNAIAPSIVSAETRRRPRARGAISQGSATSSCCGWQHHRARHRDEALRRE
jgi:hypothetical protein